MRFDFYRKEVFHVMSPENYSSTFSNSSHCVMRLASICSKINCVRISFLYIYFHFVPIIFLQKHLKQIQPRKGTKRQEFFQVGLDMHMK